MNKNKRNLVRSIALGGAATITIPKQWAKPIVDSIILPAHAQTTVDQAALAEDLCPTTFSLPDINLSCPVVVSEYYVYTISASADACPVLNSSGPFSSLPFDRNEPSDTVLYVSLRTDGEDMSVKIGNPAFVQNSRNIRGYCEENYLDQNTSGSFPILEDSSGGIWNISFDVSYSNQTSLSVTNMVLTLQ